SPARFACPSHAFKCPRRRATGICGGRPEAERICHNASRVFRAAHGAAGTRAGRMSAIPGGFWSFALAFASALLLSFGLTPLVRALALRAGVVAAPAADRWHGRSVPVLGGIAVMAATLLVVTAFGFSRQTAMVALVSTLTLGLG